LARLTRQEREVVLRVLPPEARLAGPSVAQSRPSLDRTTPGHKAASRKPSWKE